MVFIERLHKAWHYANAVKVGHFEWLTMYTGLMVKNAPNQFQLNRQRYLSKIINTLIVLLPELIHIFG